MKKITMILLFLSLIAVPTCKQRKSEKLVKGTITFVKGDVDIIKEKGRTIPAKTRGFVTKGDDIRTGKNSTVIIQFSKIGVVKIESNTLLNVSKLLMKNQTEFYLINGKIISKIVRLDPKKDKFFIKTPTAVAGLRGTTFSVEYNEGQEIVAVKEGKIAVKSVAHNKETIVTKGKTAEVSHETETKVRKTSKVEDLELEKVSYISMIENVENKKIDELKTLSDKIEVTEKKLEKKIVKEKKIEEKLKKPTIVATQKIKPKLISIAKLKEKHGPLSLIFTKDGRRYIGSFKQEGEQMVIFTQKGKVLVPGSNIRKVAPYKD